MEDRRRWLTSKSIPKPTGRPTQDLKEAQCKKDVEREKERTDESCMFQSIIFTLISHEYITQVFETIFLAVISSSNKTLMH